MTPTSAAFSRTVRVPRATSTSSELVAAVRADPDAWPHLSVLVARDQQAGRGRSGREWVTAPGTALTCSVLLRPAVPARALAWVTLIAGLAVARAAGDLLAAAADDRREAARVGIKWPNDVLVLGAGEADVEGWERDRKMAGILAETVPGRPGDVVLGIGVNVAQRADQLPVPWATSLHLAAGPAPGAARVGVDDVLDTVGPHLTGLLRRWEAAGGDAEAAGLAAEVRAACVTLGREVRVELPGAGVVTGTATGLDSGGRLLVDTGDGVRAVAAGDVRHVRATGSGRPGRLGA